MLMQAPAHKHASSLVLSGECAEVLWRSGSGTAAGPAQALLTALPGAPVARHSSLGHSQPAAPYAYLHPSRAQHHRLASRKVTDDLLLADWPSAYPVPQVAHQGHLEALRGQQRRRAACQPRRCAGR